MSLTRKIAAGAAEVDLEAGKTISEAGVIIEKSRLTYLNCQHHNPVDRLFKNKQWQSEKVVNERTSLIPLTSRSPA